MKQEKSTQKPHWEYVPLPEYKSRRLRKLAKELNELKERLGEEIVCQILTH